MKGNKSVKQEDGQILVFTVLSILSLTMLWLMVINIGKMVKDRVMMQNAADCAAQTAACIRARGLNMIGPINALLGIPVLTLGTPDFVWWPCPIPHYWVSCTHTAEQAKIFIDGLIKSQEEINKTYGGGWAWIQANTVARRQELNSRSEPYGADGIIPLDSFSLRLHRNMGSISYWGTVWVQLPAYTGPVPVPPSVKGIKVDKGKRWYEQDNGFDKKKQRIVAYKRAESISNRGYPFGKKLFSLTKMPGISAIAAAQPYNTIGPMFPKKGQKFGLKAAKEFLPFAKQHKGWDAQLVPVGSPYQH